MNRQRFAGKTGKPNAGKLARSVWSGGKVAKPYLSLRKKIMEGLGGRIYCRSKQGEGSYAEFVMEFPLVEEAKKVLGVPSS